MKILGIGYGARLGNTETMIKTALKAAEELGAEVGYIDLRMMKFGGCLDCSACFNNVEEGKADYTKCILHDDIEWIHELMLDADAMIIGGAIYSMGMPAGILTLFERTHTDLAYFTRVKERREKNGQNPPDSRIFKLRPLGLISQGGSREKHWTSFGVQHLSKFAMSANNTVVDIIDVCDLTRRMGAVGDPQLLERCAQMGRNLFEAAQKVTEGSTELEYQGDVNGMCPVCHMSNFTIDEDGNALCPLCGITGQLKYEDGKFRVEFKEEDLPHSRLFIGGLMDHQIELMNNLKERFEKMKSLGITNEELQARKTALKGYADIKRPEC